MVKGTNTSWTAQKNSNFSPQLTAQTAIYSKELDVLPDDNLFKISLYDNKIPSNVNPDNSELIEGLTSEFSFSLLPAVESQTSGRQVPDVKPGILYKYSTNIKPYPIPGRAATHQVIGFESTILQVVGLLTGFNDIISNSAGDQSILAVKQGKGNAVQAAQAFFNYVYRYGVPIRIRIRANQSANNMTMGYSDVLYNNRQPNSFVSLYHICIIQSIRYFVARHDRVYYALDLIILEEDDLWNNTSEEVFNNPTTTQPESFGDNSLAKEIASQLGENDKITQSEKDGVTTTEILLEDGSKIVITQNSDGSRKVEYFKKATDTKPSSVSITTPTGETSTTGKPPDENTPADKIIKAILKKPPNTPVVEKKEEEGGGGGDKKEKEEELNWFERLLKYGPAPEFGPVDTGVYTTVGVGLAGYGLGKYMKSRGSTNGTLDNITNKIPANSTNPGAIASVNQTGTRTGTTTALDQYLGLSNNKTYNTISYTKSNGDIVEIVYGPDGKALGGTVRDANGILPYTNFDSNGRSIILNTTTGKVQLELDGNRPIVVVEELNSSTSNTIKQTPVDFANTASDDISGLIFESGTGNILNKVTLNPSNPNALNGVNSISKTGALNTPVNNYLGLNPSQTYTTISFPRNNGQQVVVYYSEQGQVFGGYITDGNGTDGNGTPISQFNSKGEQIYLDADGTVKVKVDANNAPIVVVEELNSSTVNTVQKLPSDFDNLSTQQLNDLIFVENSPSTLANEVGGTPNQNNLTTPERTGTTKIELGTNAVNGSLEKTSDGNFIYTNPVGNSTQLDVTYVNGKPDTITVGDKSYTINPASGDFLDPEGNPAPVTLEDINKFNNTGSGTGSGTVTELDTGTVTELDTGTVTELDTGTTRFDPNNFNQNDWLLLDKVSTDGRTFEYSYYNKNTNEFRYEVYVDNELKGGKDPAGNEYIIDTNGTAKFDDGTTFPASNNTIGGESQEVPNVPSNNSSVAQEIGNELVAIHGWEPENPSPDGFVYLINNTGQVEAIVMPDGSVLDSTGESFKFDSNTKYISEQLIVSDRTGTAVVEALNPTGRKLDAQNFTETFNIPNNSATYVEVELPNDLKISFNKNTGKIIDLETGREVEMYVTPNGEIQVKSSSSDNDDIGGPKPPGEDSSTPGRDSSTPGGDSGNTQTPNEITGTGTDTNNPYKIFGDGISLNNDNFTISTGEIPEVSTADKPIKVSSISQDYNNLYPGGLGLNTNLNLNLNSNPSTEISFNGMTTAIGASPNTQTFDDGAITINLNATQRIGTNNVSTPNLVETLAHIKNTSEGDVNIVVNGGTFQIHASGKFITVGASLNELSNALTGKLGLPSNKALEIINSLKYVFN